MAKESMLPILRELSRQQMWEIWQNVKMGRPIDDPKSARIGKMMKAHPQYTRFWEKALSYKDKDVVDKKGGNPFAHVTLEAAVEAQLEMDDLPEVKQALCALMERGAKQHEARHAILRILSEEIWLILHEKRAFDKAAYRRKLKALAEQGEDLSSWKD